MSKIDDWFNVPQIEEDDQIDMGSIKIYATIEHDHYGAPFYTVTRYVITSKDDAKGTRFDYGKYNPTKLDECIDAWALTYWTPERMSELFLHHDAGLDRQLETAREVRSENQAYQEAVL